MNQMEYIVNSANTHMYIPLLIHGSNTFLLSLFDVQGVRAEMYGLTKEVPSCPYKLYFVKG